MDANSNPAVSSKLLSHPFITCAAAGAMLSVPFFDGRLFFLAFPALILFMYALFSRPRRLFALCFVFAFLFHLLLYSFFVFLYPLDWFGLSDAESAAVVVLAALGIPAVHSLLFALIFMLSRFMPRRRMLMPFFAASLWVVFEWVLSLGQLAFPWGRLAVSQYLFLPMIQTASLFGAYFIAFVMVVSCAFFALFAVAPRRSALAAGCIVLAGNILAGTLMMSIPADTDVTVKAAVVQGNIPSDEKWDKERAQDIFNTYVSLAEEAAQNGASFILLPESAVPVQFTEGGALHTAYAEITEEYGCTIVTGAIFKDDKSEYNSVIAIFPDGSLSERYVKRHIVPFGEFMPYEDVLKRAFPFLEELNIGYSDCVQGTESTVIDVCGIPAGPLVCYDSIFASLSADSVKNGAKLLAVVTNDSWYKDSAALSQHMAHSVLRAVENGTYTVRAANTGISCIIAPNGSIITMTEPETRSVAYADVGAATRRTLYSYIGDVLLYVCIAYVACTACVFIFIKIRKRIVEKHEGNKAV